MRRLCLTLCLLCAPAWAQDDSLYRAWGAKAGIQAVMQDFVARLPTDARIGARFKDLNGEHLATQLTEQLCELSGGPCRYEGPDMRSAHEGMQISKSDFNALVEVLQQAMAARGVPFGAQNRMLAKLAPLHREMIEQP
jgi:hemoglobin